MPGKFDINPQTGKQYGVNPETGVQDDNYWANTGERLAGGGSQSGSTGNVVDIAKQMFELANQFRQPAIETLQGTKPGIETAYSGLKSSAEAQKPTLESRYQSLLTDITKGTRDAATKEFTQRGIPLSSGVVDQTVGSRLAPQIQQAGVQRESGINDINNLLANIGMQEQGAYGNLAQAIAAIQAGGSSEAISSAQNIYGQQEQSRQQSAQLALQQLTQRQTNEYQQAQLAATQNQNQYLTLGEGQTVFDPITGKNIYTAPKTYKPGNTWGDIPVFPDF